MPYYVIGNDIRPGVIAKPTILASTRTHAAARAEARRLRAGGETVSVIWAPRRDIALQDRRRPASRVSMAPHGFYRVVVAGGRVLATVARPATLARWLAMYPHAQAFPVERRYDPGTHWPPVRCLPAYGEESRSPDDDTALTPVVRESEV